MLKKDNFKDLKAVLIAYFPIQLDFVKVIVFDWQNPISI